MNDGIIFEPLAPDVRAPERATRHSAGYDVRAYLKGGAVRIHRAARGEVVEAPPVTESTRSEAGGVRLFLPLEPGDRALVPTGFKARLPAGIEAQVRVRSSLAFRRGLVVPNAPGTIDADYRGEVGVILINLGDTPFTVQRGQRIAQLVIAPLARPRLIPVAALPESLRGEGGFGSTGLEKAAEDRTDIKDEGTEQS